MRDSRQTEGVVGPQAHARLDVHGRIFVDAPRARMILSECFDAQF
jgi:hypothetical protein